jgi:hypothetical protein
MVRVISVVVTESLVTFNAFTLRYLPAAGGAAKEFSIQSTELTQRLASSQIMGQINGPIVRHKDGFKVCSGSRNYSIPAVRFSY